MKETSKSIGRWAYLTFGSPAHPILTFRRARQEFEELRDLLEEYHEGIVGGFVRPDIWIKIVEECADVVIVLARLCDMCGFDLFEAVDRKMKVNRKRDWVPDGKGQGQHK